MIERDRGDARIGKRLLATSETESFFNTLSETATSTKNRNTCNN